MERMMQNTPKTARLLGLEWMTENLNVGGTEIDGVHYYTWEEAVAAAATFGDGWRLPTIEEFKQLCCLRSSWDTKRNGRWFVDNRITGQEGRIFFLAKGWQHYNGRTLMDVDLTGDYWSSTPHCNHSVAAGGLTFDAANVATSDIYYHTNGLSVRLVRDL